VLVVVGISAKEYYNLLHKSGLSKWDTISFVIAIVTAHIVHWAYYRSYKGMGRKLTEFGRAYKGKVGITEGNLYYKYSKAILGL
jgi:hypothetical protein